MKPLYGAGTASNPVEGGDRSSNARVVAVALMLIRHAVVTERLVEDRVRMGKLTFKFLSLRVCHKKDTL